MNHKHRVLVAEDEMMMQKTIEYRLKKEEYEVITAHDGRQALDFAEKMKPDVIIADIMMPFLSGLEVIKQLKSREETKNIPVIVLSAVGQEDTVLEAFRMGAEDYVTKPFSPDELVFRVKKALRK